MSIRNMAEKIEGAGGYMNAVYDLGVMPEDVMTTPGNEEEAKFASWMRKYIQKVNEMTLIEEEMDEILGIRQAVCRIKIV